MYNYFEIQVKEGVGVWKTHNGLPEGVLGKRITVVRAKELLGMFYANDIKEGLTLCTGKHYYWSKK